MTEKKVEIRRIAWEYEQVDTKNTPTRQYEDRLKRLGQDGWEAYAVVGVDDGELRFFLKRPVTIDPPPDGGRATRAPIDPPPDGG